MAVNKRLLQGAAAAPGGITPSEHFGVMLYEGDGASSHSINGGKFGAGAYMSSPSSSSQYIALPEGIINGATGDISVSFWMNTTYSSAQMFILTTDITPYYSKIAINTETNGKLRLSYGNASNSENNFYTTSTNLLNGNWHHIVYTLDIANTTAKIYVNGSLETTHTTTITPALVASPKLTIGNVYRSDTSAYQTNSFKGKLDQFRFFHKILSSTEVSTLYAETASTVESLDPLSEDTTDTLQVLGDTSCTSLYRFENNEDDESGNYDATGTKIQYAAGRYGQAVEFGARGNNSYVDMTTATTPTTSTLSLWFKTSHNNSDWTLIVDGGGSRSSDTGYAIFRSGDGGYINLYFTDSDTGNSQLFTGNINITDDIWHHIVLSMASDNTFVLYLDGSSHLSGTRTKWTSGDTHSVSTVRFGNSSTVAANSGNQFYGEIDQVRTFNKALSASEATTLYNENSLVASYRFEGNANDDTRNYDGTASNVTYEYGLGFTPDWVWIKNRDTARGHNLFDSTRGVNKVLFSNSTSDEGTETAGTSLSSFDTGGFTVGSGNGVNEDTNDFVAWCWKANGGTTSSNTDGSITSTVQANQDAGFSIVKYSGNATNDATVGHGLSQAPELWIGKQLSGNAINWQVLYSGFSEGDYLSLNLTNAKANSANVSFDPTATTVKFQGGQALNDSGEDYIGYAFHSVDGFSKFGSYTGNGSTNGPIVETGFEPAFLMIKRTDSTGDWRILDNKRSLTNPRNEVLKPNSSEAEESDSPSLKVDFLSNGFQLKSTHSSGNTNNATYIYMAFAADPDTEAPAVAKSFNAVVYSGNSSSDGPILDIGFNPGLVWIKAIETTSTGDKSHRLHDVVRGQQSFLKSDTTDAASSSGDRLNFNYSDTQIQIINASKGWNDNGYRYITWAWKADDNEPTLFGGAAKAVYKFEDNGNDVTGSWNATPTSITYGTGKFNKGAIFNGTSSKFTTSSSFDGTNGGSFSLSLWVKFDDVSTNENVILGRFSYTTSDKQFILRLTSSSTWRISVYNSSGSGESMTTTETASTDTWYHLVVVVDGTKKSIYVDGDLLKSETGSISPNSSATGALEIGGSRHLPDPDNNGDRLEGMMDQLRIFNAALTDVQVAALYAETASDNDDLFLGGPPETIISANANAGFSIVKWEGTGTQTKIPHGLSAVPEMIISKRLDSTNNWSVYHKSLDLSHSTYPNWAYLNLTNAQQNSGSAENHPYYARPSASHIFQNTGTSEGTNVAGAEYISYCWHAVSGYSAFGYWQGGTTTINIGFRADFVLYQDFGAGGSWTLVDSVRSDDVKLLANSSAAESSQSLLTITDTGFTVTSESSIVKRLYMAFKIN